jgi:hypothetical protein
MGIPNATRADSEVVTQKVREEEKICKESRESRRRWWGEDENDVHVICTSSPWERLHCVITGWQ